MNSLLMSLMMVLITLICKKDHSTVTGNFEGKDGKKFFINNIWTDKLDSVELKNGKFKYDIEVNELGFFVIYTEDKLKYSTFFIEKNVDLKISDKDGEMSSISFDELPGPISMYEAGFNIEGGGEVQKEYIDYKKTVNEIYIQEFGLTASQFFYKNKDQLISKSITDEMYDKITICIGEELKFISNYISQNPKSYVAAELLRRYAILFDIDTFNNYFNNIDESLKTSTIYEEIVELIPQFDVNSLTPDFTQNDINGNPIKLSDEYKKGRYLLLEFWASWCAPCRVENPNLIKAYKKYQNKGFNIIGVSLDSDKEKWEKAIKEDKLIWTHVSDLKGINNEVAKLYVIRAVPQNYLIDNTGKILAINIFGEELNKMLAILFKE